MKHYHTITVTIQNLSKNSIEQISNALSMEFNQDITPDEFSAHEKDGQELTYVFESELLPSESKEDLVNLIRRLIIKIDASLMVTVDFCEI